MKFDMTVIENLLKSLDAGAETANAKAKEHALTNETDSEHQQLRRFARCKEYSENLRGLVEDYKAKSAKRPPFKKPTTEEVKAYAIELGWPYIDAMKWYDHFESNGWLVGGKTPMKDWKAAARTGFKNWQEKNPGRVQRAAPITAQDPEGWAAWLTQKGVKYEGYKYAAPYLKDDFRKETQA